MNPYFCSMQRVPILSTFGVSARIIGSMFSCSVTLCNGNFLSTGTSPAHVSSDSPMSTVCTFSLSGGETSLSLMRSYGHPESSNYLDGGLLPNSLYANFWIVAAAGTKASPTLSTLCSMTSAS